MRIFSNLVSALPCAGRRGEEVAVESPGTRLVRSVLSRAGAAFRSRGSLVRRGEGHGAQRHHIHGASRAARQAVAVPGQEGRRDDQGETPSADAAVHVHARGQRPAQPARRSGQSRPPGDQGLGRGHPHDEEGGAGHGGRNRRRGAHRRVRLRARHQGARRATRWPSPSPFTWTSWR